MSWITTAVRRPVLVTVLFTVIILFGIVSFSRLPVDLFPEIEPPVISVITMYPGASAGDVEVKITEHLEETLGTISGVEKISSVSRESLSVVTLQFAFGIDLDEANNEIRQNLEFTARELPDDAEDSQIFKFDTSKFPIIIFTVSSATTNIHEDRDIIEDRIIEPLRSLPGVGSVRIFNAPERIVRVDIVRDRLVANELTVSEVARAIGSENITVPAGNIDVGNMEFAVRVPGDATTLDDLKGIVVKRGRDGSVIRVEDVAMVRESIDDLTEMALVDGQITIAGGLLKRSGANTVEVAEAAKERLAEIKETLPPGMDIHLVNDGSEFIVRMISNLQRTVMLGGGLVLLVTLAFLGRLRPSLIVALAIPTSMIIAFLMMFVAGFTINAITLMAMSLGIGMVVDNAIVVLENITRFIDQGEEPQEAAVKGASEVGAAILASTLTTVVIFAPMIFVSGLVGIMFGQLAYVMIVTIAASLLVALTLTPMLAARWVSRSEGKTLLGRLLVHVEAFYGRVVGSALRHPWLVLTGTGVLFLITLCGAGMVGTDFVPDQDSGEVRVTVELPVGTNLETTARISERIRRAMENQPEARLIFERAGTSASGFSSAIGEKEGSNVATISVRLVPLSERSRSAGEIARAALAEVGPIPEALNVDVAAGSMFNRLLGFGTKPVQVEVLGSDFAKMESVAATLVNRIKQVDGTTDVAADLLQTRPEVRFEISKDLASRVGVPFGMAASEMRTATIGQVATRYTGGDTPRDVLVRLRKEDRDEIGELGQVPVRSMAGEYLRLGDISSINEGEVSIEIKRVDKTRMIKVGAAIDGRALGDVAADVDGVLDDLEVPPGIIVRYGGNVKEQRESFADLFRLLALGFILVYLVMAAQFESWLVPFVIMFSVPFAITGAVLALLVTGTTMSVPGFLGLIILIGVVVNNAIVLLDYTMQLEAGGMTTSAALRMAGERRLRPVLMTALTTIGGMVPLAMATGDGAEMWGPMGRTAVGGLALSTAVTLVLVPVMYLVMTSLRSRFMGLFGRPSGPSESQGGPKQPLTEDPVLGAEAAPTPGE